MKKLTFAFLFISFYLSISGCASLKNWIAAGPQKREFQVENVWATSLTRTDNLAFKKINRFSPLLYRSKKLGDTVIQANAVDGITAFEQDSKRKLWHQPILNGIESSAVVKGSYLFFGANDGQFYCLDADTGSLVWTFPTRIENLSEPLIEDGVVYFLTGANSLYALEASTGKQLWLYSRPDTSSLSIRGGSKPAHQNGTLFVGFSDGALVAINAKTGNIKWEKQLNRNKKFRDLDTDPFVDGEYLYATGFDDATYALRVATGDIAWRIEKGGYGGFLMSGDRLFFASSNEELISADKTTGRIIWTKKSNDGIPTEPRMLKGILVYGESQGKLRFLESSSGREIGHFEPGKGILSRPTIDDKRNMVYFISGEANLYGIHAYWK